ncbi:TPA: FAD-dependent monooxygenase [Klebsiella pneumoniae]|nr:FAD-dependent monooxygenase [Klebsiella pneumoniae]HCI6085740.1 FAD-dependent monooxygenase [Klebsiella pneumoniae]
MKQTAIIVGGSIAGLLTANILFRHGWSVKLFERSAKGLEARGAGIAMQRTLRNALELAGVDVSKELGIGINNRVGYLPDGSVVTRCEYAQTTTSWGVLYESLLAALPEGIYKKGAVVDRVFNNELDATVRLSNGEVHQASLVIGADGIHSRVREMVAPEVKPVYAGYVAWRGMLEENEFPAGLSQDDFTSFNFGFLNQEEAVAYPVAGTGGSIDVGKRRFNMMWYRPAPKDELHDILTGSDGTYYGQGIPPHLIRTDVLTNIRKIALNLPPVFARTIPAMQSLFVQPIFDLESHILNFGKVTLVGDAAFVARPHCGAGVSKAAADAVALLNALQMHDDISTALAHYSDERVAAGRDAVNWARKLGTYLQCESEGHVAGQGTKPVTAEEVVRYTGIELSEISDVRFG